MSSNSPGIDFCNGCGWQRPIVQEHSKGHRSFMLCAACIDNMVKRNWEGLDIMKQLEMFLGHTFTAHKVPKEVPPAEQGTILDPNQPIDPLFEVRPQEHAPSDEDIRRAVAETRALIRALIVGTILGGFVGGSIVLVLARYGFL